METTLIQSARSFAEKKFEDPIFEKLGFHNIIHTEQVIGSTVALAEKAQLSESETELLVLAAIFHDLGYAETYDSHEEASMKIARDFLLSQEIELEKVQEVVSLIEATKIESKADNHLKQLIKDADLVGMSHKDLIERGQLLRKEWATFKNIEYTDVEWDQFNYDSIKEMNYSSPEGKQLYGKKRKKNLKELKKKLPGKKLLTIDNTIATSKSAQTMFKTTLRNEIGLSAIADNKANMMLSVNALIITIAFPLLAENIRTYPHFLFPSAVLLIVSISSMIFATLATRPIQMNGRTPIEEIGNLKTNLFFFGNFYKMSFAEYLAGIEKVVASNEILDNSIIRDHFFLGKSLGTKYQYLRMCYNIFMYGLVLTVFVFLMVVLLNN